MKKLSNTEAELKKSVAYKKKGVKQPHQLESTVTSIRSFHNSYEKMNRKWPLFIRFHIKILWQKVGTCNPLSHNLETWKLILVIIKFYIHIDILMLALNYIWL